MDRFTAKNYSIGKAPKRIKLEGDKTERAEPGQYIIEFPGGAIEVTRTTDGNYWAHIIVNRKEHRDAGGKANRGKIVDSRIDRHAQGVAEIENADGIEQVAVLIRPEGKE